MDKYRILLVEDESGIADNIRYALDKACFEVDWVMLGEAALRHIETASYACVVLDVGLPDMDGFEVCREIRKGSDLPVIFLTARGEEIDRVVGLELGADDYVAKPFSPRELVARVKSNVRRYTGQSLAEDAGPFLLDESRRTIRYHQQTLDLTRYEYGILCLLLKRPGRVYSREQILESVWVESENSIDRVVDGHIKTLRGKLKAIDGGENPVKTHRGIGYSLGVK